MDFLLFLVLILFIAAIAGGVWVSPWIFFLLAVVVVLAVVGGRRGPRV